MAVEHALFYDHHAKAISTAIDDARAHAAAGALTAGNDRVHMEEIQVADQRRAPERARRRLADNRLAGKRLDFVDNVIAAPEPVLRFGVFIGLELGLAPVRTRRHAGAIEAGRVNDGNARLTRLGEKFLNFRNRIPAVHTAVARPFFDCFQYGIGSVSVYPAIKIDKK